MSNERDITCCFTGHRAEKLPWGHREDDPRCQALKGLIADVLRDIYDSGWRHFLCGMATGGDMYFGEAVAAMREERPDITLEAAIPYDSQDRNWSAPLRARYARLTEACDMVTVLRSDYAPGCMMDRNRYMVDRSSLLIAAFDGKPGGTLNTQRYAESRGLTIIQLPVTDIPGF